ncbi:MAG: hypothetical protein ACRBBP_11730 [Bdellovibrionales bacterium]
MKLILLLSFIVFSSMTSAFSFRKSILKRSQIESITAEMLNDWYGVND